MIYPSEYLYWLDYETRKIEYDIYASCMFPGEQKIIVPERQVTAAYPNGSPELREVLAKKYNMKKENVFVTTGVSLLNTLIVNTFSDAHQIVAVEKPRYEPLILMPESLGCTVVPMERNFEEEWYLHMPKYTPKLMIITNPHNPTGTSLNKKNIDELVNYAEENNSLILSDEVYNDCSFIKSPPLASLTKNAITVSHLNKSYGLGMLKIGWAIADEEKIHKLERANTLYNGDLFCSVDDIAQEVLKKETEHYCNAMARLRPNYCILYNWIESRHDVEWVKPNGTPVAFIKTPIKDTKAFVEDLINNYSTRVAAGAFFGAEGFLRIGYACKPEILKEGLKRLGQALDRWKY